MFIQGCKSDWSNTDSDTYLRYIPALHTDYIPFTKPFLIFTIENSTGKSTLPEAMAIPSGFNSEGGTKTMPFPLMIIIQSYKITEMFLKKLLEEAE